MGISPMGYSHWKKKKIIDIKIWWVFYTAKIRIVLGRADKHLSFYMIQNIKSYAFQENLYNAGIILSLQNLN